MERRVGIGQGGGDEQLTGHDQDFFGNKGERFVFSCLFYQRIGLLRIGLYCLLLFVMGFLG